MTMDFALNHQGRAVIRRAKGLAKSNPDRFEAARDKAEVKWRTNGLTII
jgi:antitoxin PrlF